MASASIGQNSSQDSIGKALGMGNASELYMVMECGEQVGV